MSDVCFYFQVHQPFRLRQDFDYFAIGRGLDYEDERQNSEILRKVADNCYLPANAVMLELIKANQGRFRIAYSISGVALEQFAKYDPRVIESFRQLAETGAVEFLGETYHHSLAFLYSKAEFARQVALHQTALQRYLGVKAETFRNTELIYNNDLAAAVQRLGFTTVLAEGADHILRGRSPAQVYRPHGAEQMTLLLKNYRLSDDIAFRFSQRDWNGWPLTADKFSDWLVGAATEGPLVNLFMDYETFGEHQPAASGIFDFLRALPAAVLSRGLGFVTPKEAKALHQPTQTLDVPHFISWADAERDTSAWLGNHMQNAAAKAVYDLEGDVLAVGDEALAHLWRKLQTSDHFYYMCTKFWADGDVHKYFSPFASPHDAFIFYCNALNELKVRLKNAEVKKPLQLHNNLRSAFTSPVTQAKVWRSAETAPVPNVPRTC